MLVRAENGKHRIERKVQHLSVASIRLLFGVATIEKSTHEYQHCVAVRSARTRPPKTGFQTAIEAGILNFPELTVQAAASAHAPTTPRRVVRGTELREVVHGRIHEDARMVEMAAGHMRVPF